MNKPSDSIAVRIYSHKSGFTLLELIVVIAGLGILASLAIPNFLKYLEFAQIDEAKSLLNAAASECLQKYRASAASADWQNFQPDALKSRSLPGKYTFKTDPTTKKPLNTCEQISIYDPISDTESTYLPSLSFTIAGGKIIKESEYSNPESEQACKSWGNCGGSPSAKYLKGCFQSKQTCDSNLSTALAINADRRLGFMAWTGQCTWPSTDCGCNREVWACSQTAYYSSADFEQCLSAKATAACNAHRESLKSKQFTGVDAAGKCPSQTWWLSGTMFTLESDYQTAKCEKDYELWKKDGINNSSFMSAGCTQSAYKCLINNQMKVFEGTTKMPSDCTPPAPPTPAPPTQRCRIPDLWYCQYLPNRPDCQPICN